jgi:hypothetical protein
VGIVLPTSIVPALRQVPKRWIATKHKMSNKANTIDYLSQDMQKSTSSEELGFGLLQDSCQFAESIHSTNNEQSVDAPQDLPGSNNEYAEEETDNIPKKKPKPLHWEQLLDNTHRIWAKELKGLSVSVDIPRLARHIQVTDRRSSKSSCSSSISQLSQFTPSQQMDADKQQNTTPGINAYLSYLSKAHVCLYCNRRFHENEVNMHWQRNTGSLGFFNSAV